MDFTKLDLKIKYRSSDDDIVEEFYVPVLDNAITYKRAVGFFSSSSLIEISKGITGLIKNDGKVFIVASPKLQAKDIEAINKGYEEREKIIEQVIMDSICNPKDYFEEQRLNLLAHLIASGRLDIKIAFMESKGKIGIYHEKIGIIYDAFGNKIAFTGSLNESSNAFSENFESIDVFFSWKGDDNAKRVYQKEKDFNLLWKDQTNKIKVINFPDIAKEKLESYKIGPINYDIDKKCKETTCSYNIGDIKSKEKYPLIPDNIRLYDFQQEAIRNWENDSFRGIFNMATGTGKTITGLGAVARLSEKLNNNIAVIIVCPYQHLVEQWVEDIILFNMDPIIGYSTSVQRDWKKMLKYAVIDFNLGVINHFCFVTTNATYSSDFVQKQINKIKGEVVLIVDEAHNFGALRLSEKLNDFIPYRLALSATLERYGDSEGTQKLYNYFGEECINYSLEKAIEEKKLTPYYYYPILTCLTEDELIKYKQLSIKLSKCFIDNKNGDKILSDIGKKIAIKRARLVAGSVNKLYALKENIKPYINSSHMLVYCGATTIKDPDYIEGSADKDELRQIIAVSKILGNELGMKVAQFTSEETAQERKILKREFAQGEDLQVLVAIRCLDEGVNIPKIKMAFILASSSNPKEYIQRRGRVLRRAEGKEYAVIFDYVTIPRPLEEVKNIIDSEIKYDISLIKKEIARVEDFSNLSLNPQEGDKLINKLTEVYDMNKINGGFEYEY